MNPSKKTVFICLNLLLTFAAVAQRSVTDPKHENHYAVKPIETPEVKIEFINAHSQQNFTLVKLKITNKTNDYIMYKSTETVFKYAFGDVAVKGGGLFSSAVIIIDPKSTDTKELKVSGGDQFHVQDLKLDLGGFYRVDAKGTIVKVPDFLLPAASNDFTAGPFQCTLVKTKQQTSETSAKFNCVYMGDNIAIVNPSKITFGSKLEQKYANDNRSDKTKLMEAKDEYKFTATVHIPGKLLDMQFNTLSVIWNDTFSESKAVAFKVGTVDFVFDQQETLLKNR